MNPSYFLGKWLEPEDLEKYILECILIGVKAIKIVVSPINIIEEKEININTFSLVSLTASFSSKVSSLRTTSCTYEVIFYEAASYFSFCLTS